MSLVICSSSHKADFYNSNDVQLYATPDGCRSNEYFDLFAMKCLVCDDGLHLIPGKDSEYRRDLHSQFKLFDRWPYRLNSLNCCSCVKK
ncbi:AGAP002548-PA-like protein [Anopheles sinensis]|uniref:AGAP002548-PA-like protein n=1 Tax=Anopheles sinensis TaxID=74873 RepID=A0A084VCX9_ANOSI|nr:AGAP002548-PA-like protein [Anopheles sinensis]